MLGFEAMPSSAYTKKELPERIHQILAEARADFGAEKVQREPLRQWYENRYGYKWVPPEIVKNGYLQVPGERGWYWLDPKRMNSNELSPPELTNEEEPVAPDPTDDEINS